MTTTETRYRDILREVRSRGRRVDFTTRRSAFLLARELDEDPVDTYGATLLADDLGLPYETVGIRP